MDLIRLPMKFAVTYYNTLIEQKVEIAAFYFLSDAEQFIECQAASHKYHIEQLGDQSDLTDCR